MSKEIKIGLGVITLLLVIFGVVVVQRISGTKEVPAASVPAVKKSVGSEYKSSGPGAEATVVKASATTSKSDSPANRWRQDEGTSWVGAEAATRRQDARQRQPGRSFLPRKGVTQPHRNEAQQQGDSRQFDPFSSRRLHVPTQQASGNTAGLLRPAEDAQLRPSPGRVYQTPTDDSNPLRGFGPQTALVGGTTAEQRSTSAQIQVAQQPSWQHYKSAARRRAEPSVQVRQDSTQRYPVRVSPASIARIAPTTPRIENKGSYSVGPNDSFYAISKKIYGTGDFFKALIEHNRKKYPEPNQLRVGDKISTPTVAMLRKNYPVLCPKKRKQADSYYRATTVSTARRQGRIIYKVQEGDTLFSIASDRLGRIARSWEIYELNRKLIGDDYDHLKPGWELILPGNRKTPKSRAVDSVAREPARTLRR